MIKRLYLIILLCFSIQLSFAQTNEEEYRSIYDNAEKEFDIGRLEQAEEILRENIKNFSLSLRQSAYRMLSICYLEMDRNEDAEQSVKQLLIENPYYSTTLSDPQRFIDLVESMKSGMTATITTASSQAENLTEVPVPTTLITEEMIKVSGARNLQEILAIYVPGMNVIDCNDDINISMRGIYSNGQEKILIMLNGHTLNSYSTNIASPDFSIGLEKLKQIEVLRGPASSLYGNVALTAVVNLITKQGADVDGIKLKLGGGNHGQMRGDALFGKRYFDLDVLLWGSFYKAKGEKVYIPKEQTGLGADYGTDGYARIGGIGTKPSYDYGTSIKYKKIQFFYNSKFSQVQSPLSFLFLYSPYNIDAYKTFDGAKPSFITKSHHAHFSYGEQIKNVYLKGSILYDYSEMAHYQVVSDTNIPTLFEWLPLPFSAKKFLEENAQGGFSRYMSGQEHTFGFKTQGDWVYIKNKNHNGLLSFGAEYSYFKMDDARYIFGYNFNETLPETNLISELGKGHENSFNAYIQLKHQWKSFIINSGVRFDYKNKYDDSQIKEFSPRLSLIYLQPKWNIKISYSKAFIDAPYFYRKSNSFLYALATNEKLTFSDNINPESLHSYQVTFGATQWIKGLNFEVNAFFNHATDLVWMKTMEHENAVNIDLYGLEFSGRYQLPRFSVNLTAAWQKSHKYEYFYENFDKPFNTPELSANTILNWKATKNLNIHGHIGVFSKQTNRILNIVNYVKYNKASSTAIDLTFHFMEKYETTEYLNLLTPEEKALYDKAANDTQYYFDNLYTNYEINPYFIIDMGANYKIGNCELGFNVHNLLNRQYTLSGAGCGLIPQKGRWFMFDISYKF